MLVKYKGILKIIFGIYTRCHMLLIDESCNKISVICVI